MVIESTGGFMIKVRELTRFYGDKIGVKDVSFTINKGEMVGLLGPNGAGKSTIMKMITGYLMPTSGTITIDGMDAIEKPDEVSSKIGYMPEIPPLYTDMVVEEYLKFASEIKGIKKNERKQCIEDVMDITSITDVRKRLIKNLSKGYRQRVGLAQALIGMPEILILDEPTVGLDPKQIAEVRSLLVELSKKHTIIISSHILSEISKVCKKIIVINQGHIVAEDTTENLGADDNGDKFTIKLLAKEEEAIKVLEKVDGVSSVEITSNDVEAGNCRLNVTGEGEETRVKVFNALAKAQMPITELKSARLTLEQTFLNLISSAGEAKEETK